MSPRIQLLTLAVAVLGVTLSGPSTVSATVPRVTNRKPAEPHQTIKLEEPWRVGGQTGDLIFGTVTEAATDPQDNVYLLDTQLCQVQRTRRGAPTAGHPAATR